MTEDDQKEFLAAQIAVPPGRYQHYAAGATYVVIGYVYMSEHDQWGVLYIPEDDRAKLCAQCISRFTEDVDLGKPRFKRIIIFGSDAT